MHAYLFLRMRQQMAAQASHFHTAHKANASKSCTASLPPSVRLSICSETSPTNCRRFSDFPVRPEGLLLPPADGGARAGSSTSAAGGGSTRRSRAAEISAKRCVASLTFSGLRSGCQRMASFLNAAAITSALGGPPSAPSSTPSTSAASCSRDGISERCVEHMSMKIGCRAPFSIESAASRYSESGKFLTRVRLLNCTVTVREHALNDVSYWGTVSCKLMAPPKTPVDDEAHRKSTES